MLLYFIKEKKKTLQLFPHTKKAMKTLFAKRYKIVYIKKMKGI